MSWASVKATRGSSLGIPDAWRFAIAAAVSVLGDGIRFAVTPLLATRLGAAPAEIGALLTASTLPFIAVSAFGGLVVDRVDRRRLMIGVDIVRALIGSVVAVLVFEHAVTMPVLFVAAVMLGTGETVHVNASTALLPELLSDQEALGRFNGRLSSVRESGRDLLGPMVGTALFAIARGIPFLLDAATFATAALLILGIRYRPSHVDVGEHHGFLRELGEGWTWMSQHRGVLLMAISGAAANFAIFAGLGVTAPFVLRVLHGTSTEYALLLSLEAAVGLLTSLFVHHLQRVISGPFAIGAATAVLGAAKLMMSVSPDLILVYVSGALTGLAVVILTVVSVTYMQRITPREIRGRISGLYTVIVWGALPVGSAVGGVFASQFGIRSAFAIPGIVLLGVAVAIIPALRRVRPASDVPGSP